MSSWKDQLRDIKALVQVATKPELVAPSSSKRLILEKKRAPAKPAKPIQPNIARKLHVPTQHDAPLYENPAEKSFRREWMKVKDEKFQSLSYDHKIRQISLLKNLLPRMKKHPLYDEVRDYVDAPILRSTRHTKTDSFPTMVIAPMKPEVRQELSVPSNFVPISRQTLGKQAHFRQPEPWVELGCFTQPPDQIAMKGHAVDIYIGIDFGTSFSKAAVGFADKIYPVDWVGVASTQNQYLLPTEYTVDKDGIAYLGQHPDASVEDLRSDLKLPFMSPSISSKSIEIASVYIAQVLKYVRAWVYQRHLRKLNGAHIRWHLNMGMPSNGFEETRLKESYENLLKQSWFLSTRASRYLKPSSILEKQSEVSNLSELDLVSFDLIPEFVAQMAGYMQSSQRVGGLHALIDVGGGTLDVVTFNVHDINDEDAFPFLVPQVEALGTHKLLQNRFVELGGEKRKLAIASDEDESISDPARFSSENGVDLDHVIVRDQVFRREVSHLISAVFGKTKSRRYRLAPEWKSGVRTFFTGGGANLSIYQEALEKAAIPGTSKLTVLQLPIHSKLDEFKGDQASYQRISVACGLAQNAWNFGVIVPAKEVEDDLPASAPVRERLSAEELYPK